MSLCISAHQYQLLCLGAEAGQRVRLQQLTRLLNHHDAGRHLQRTSKLCFSPLL